ncbi:MAG: hypothetical protein QXK06_01745 [Candidatus Diapherotrites archaeon]
MPSRAPTRKPLQKRIGFNQAARQGIVSGLQAQRVFAARKAFRVKAQTTRAALNAAREKTRSRTALQKANRLTPSENPAFQARANKLERERSAFRIRAQRERLARAKPLTRKPQTVRPVLRLNPPKERLERAKNGLRKVFAAGYRTVRPVAEREAGRLAESGARALNETSATIHYAFGEGISATGDLARHTVGTSVRAASEVGKATVSTVGAVGAGVAGSAVSAAGEIVGGTAVGAINAAGSIAGRTANAAISTAGSLIAEGAEYGIGLAGRGIRFGAKATAKTARGLFIVMPRALAKRVLQYIGDRRAVSRMVNPNLKGKWHLYVQQNPVLTRDGFVQHVIWRDFKVRGGETHTMQVAVEFGFTSSGKFTVRSYPMLTGNADIDALNQRLFQRKFRVVQKGVRSLTRRLGGAKGIGEIREMALSMEAFPEKPYAEPPSKVVASRELVPENAALSEAEISSAFEEAREIGEPG